MDDKQQLLSALQEEMHRWEDILSSMDEERITAPQLASNWSIKDVISHLWGWQQRSIARLEAALHNSEPQFPEWPAEFDPEVEGEPDALNAWLYEASRQKSWSQVYQDWKDDFLRYLELGKEIPEADLIEPNKYTWLEGWPVAEVLRATCEHYEEHRDWLVAWLREH